MQRRPRAPGSPVLDAVLIERIVLVGVLMLVGSFGMFMLALERGLSSNEARTIAVNTFVAIEIVYLFNCRSLVMPITRIAPFSNPWVWWGTGLMALLQLALTYTTTLNNLFATAPISARAWLEIGAAALVSLLVIEVEKRLRKPRV
jgi:magnesium-transporting ATPase (P-type)